MIVTRVVVPLLLGLTSADGDRDWRRYIGVEVAIVFRGAPILR